MTALTAVIKKVVGDELMVLNFEHGKFGAAPR